MTPFVILMSLGLGACAPIKSHDMELSTETEEGLERENPSEFALHDLYANGLFNREIVDQHVSTGDAAKVPIGHSRFKIQNVRYEVYENSKISSNELVTQFAFVEATYVKVMDNGGSGFVQDAIDYHFIVLDAFGKPSDKFGTISFQNSLKNGWTKKIKEGGDLSSFYKLLPAFARTRLWHATGFLRKNAGRPIIRYNITSTEGGKIALKLALNFAPKIVENIVGKVLDFIIKDTIKRGIDTVFADEDLHVGASFTIEDATAIKFAKDYINYGREFWNKYE